MLDPYYAQNHASTIGTSLCTKNNFALLNDSVKVIIIIVKAIKLRI